MSYDAASYSPEAEDGYFAALPSDKLPEAVWARFQDGIQQLKTTGRHGRMLRSWSKYYSLGNKGTWGDDGTEIGKSGRQGEITTISPAHYRNLTQHVLATVSGTPTSRRAEAINTDTESTAQAMLADGIVEYYAADRKLDERLAECLERALVFGEAWIGAPWDPNLGEVDGTIPIVDEAGEESERMKYAGDFAFPVGTPYDVVQDRDSEDPDAPNWLIAQRKMSRYRLMALYPQHAEEIRKLEGYSAGRAEMGFSPSAAKYDDCIPVLEFYARKGPELVAGRKALVVSPSLALLDTGLDYDEIPYFRMAPSDIIMSEGGYSNMFDMLPLCDAITAQMTTLLTNNTAFGVQMIGLPTGGDIAKQDVGPLTFLRYTPGHEPKPIQLTASAPEAYKFLEVLIAQAGQMSGVSENQRGNVSKSSSGAKEALLYSAAQQFQGPIQKAKARCEEALLTHLVDTIKIKVTDKRIATIGGKFNASASRSYTGDDVAGVSRVRVRTGDPSLSSPEGREKRLRLLMEMQFPSFVNAEQVIAFLETGRFEHMTESAQAELMLIKKENEILGDPEALRDLGGEVKVAPFDKHAMHIAEHLTVLNDPVARVSDPARIDAASKHMLRHIEALTPGTEGFAGMQVLQVTGQQPLGAPAPPGGPAAPANDNAPPGGPANDNGDAGGAAPGGLPVQASGPVNPATGEQIVVDTPPAGNQAAG